MHGLIQQLAPYLIRHIDMTDTPNQQIDGALCTLENHILCLGIYEAVNAGYLPESFVDLTVNQACALAGRCAETYHSNN